LSVLPLVAAGLLAAGCACSSPYIGQGTHPQITRGRPNLVLDTVGNALSLPFKLILWNKAFNSHCISPDTEARLAAFLQARNRPAFEEATFRLNQYTPIQDLKALFSNTHIAWPYRYTFGLLTTVLYDVLLPGRLLPLGDYYNSFTNTAHLYSDDPTIALHEAGHAYDFADFPYKGTYTIIRRILFVDLYQEKRATEEAVDYFIQIGDRPMEYRAYRKLWPAYGTYVGSYVQMPLNLSPYVGALLGHALAHVKVLSRRRYYDRMDAALNAPRTTGAFTPPVLPPTHDTPSTIPTSSGPAAP
jgi:hypothetical protein